MPAYDHVIVAVGAHKPNLPAVKGAEYLHDGLDFLKEYNRKDHDAQGLIKPGISVVVVGGGDAAVDGIEALIAEAVFDKSISLFQEESKR